MKRILLIALTCGLVLVQAARADEARLLRFPATNGTDVVFSYAGDLFTAPLAGGEAKRLTSHVGYEMFARYSPDGKTINAMSVVSKHELTIIDFWASWCSPCMQEMPHMVELYKIYKDKGLGQQDGCGQRR